MPNSCSWHGKLFAIHSHTVLPAYSPTGPFTVYLTPLAPRLLSISRLCQYTSYSPPENAPPLCPPNHDPSFRAQSLGSALTPPTYTGVSVLFPIVLPTPYDPHLHLLSSVAQSRSPLCSWLIMIYNNRQYLTEG